MAGTEVDVGGPSKREFKKGASGFKRAKRRIGIRIDMTPMVDIAFLLLIFYMVTTVFSAPQAMEISLPPDKDATVPIAESKLLTILVDEDGNLYWNMARETPQPLEFDSLRALLLRQNEEQPKLVTVVGIAREARFTRMVDVIDEVQIVERHFKETDPNFSYRFSLTSLSEFHKRELSEARKLIGGGGS
jgi:biopolymer transport protein ExbD